MFLNGAGEIMFIEGNLTDKHYVHILQNSIFNSTLKLGIRDSDYFQYGKDPKHTANITRLCFLYKWKISIENPITINESQTYWELLAYFGCTSEKRKLFK